MREALLGPDHPDVASSLDTLGAIYRAQGKYALAVPVYKRALAIYDQAFGGNHPDVAISLNNLGSLYLDQGQYELAELLLKRSLVILENSFGAGHPDAAIVRANLARLDETIGFAPRAQLPRGAAQERQGSRGEVGCT